MDRDVIVLTKAVQTYVHIVSKPAAGDKDLKPRTVSVKILFAGENSTLKVGLCGAEGSQYTSNPSFLMAYGILG